MYRPVYKDCNGNFKPLYFFFWSNCFIFFHFFWCVSLCYWPVSLNSYEYTFVKRSIQLHKCKSVTALTLLGERIVLWEVSELDEFVELTVNERWNWFLFHFITFVFVENFWRTIFNDKSLNNRVFLCDLTVAILVYQDMRMLNILKRTLYSVNISYKRSEICEQVIFYSLMEITISWGLRECQDPFWLDY